MELKLSEHFMLKEFEKSATAVACGIDNTIPPQFIPRLEQLCKVCLEPLREFAQQPIIISSGYRCPTLNLKVGGVYASQQVVLYRLLSKLPSLQLSIREVVFRV